MVSCIYFVREGQNHCIQHWWYVLPKCNWCICCNFSRKKQIANARRNFDFKLKSIISAMTIHYFAGRWTWDYKIQQLIVIHHPLKRNSETNWFLPSKQTVIHIFDRSAHCFALPVTVCMKLSYQTPYNLHTNIFIPNEQKINLINERKSNRFLIPATTTTKIGIFFMFYRKSDCDCVTDEARVDV